MRMTRYARLENVAKAEDPLRRPQKSVGRARHAMHRVLQRQPEQRVVMTKAGLIARQEPRRDAGLSPSRMPADSMSRAWYRAPRIGRRGR